MSEANSHKQSKPMFDPTINYGHVLTALSIVIAGTGAYYGMSVELHHVDQRVAKIEATLQQCKRRSNNPSLKRPGIPAAPE